MEKRIRKLTIVKAGGNASQNAVSYRLALPNLWVNEMGLTAVNREVAISFDGEKIIVEKLKGVEKNEND